MEVLLDNRNQYIEHLLDIFTIPLLKRIYNSIFFNVKKFIIAKLKI